MNKHLFFFKNKKIVITGNTGFKGSWLSYVLLNLGAKVYGYSKKIEKDHLNFRVLKLKNKIFQTNGDVCDKIKLTKFLKKTKPDIIFHLAAQSLVKKSYNDPINTFKSNSIGVLNVLEISRNLKNLKSLVIVTSDKCYKNSEKKGGYKENDHLSGSDPYSGSKAAAEIIFNSYKMSFYDKKLNLGLVSARAGNVIGGGDWSQDRIIPDFIKSIKYKKKFIIRSPKSTRPWQHVFDLINGYLLLSFKSYGNNKFNGSWNFGPNKTNSIQVLEIINFMKKYLNLKKKIVIKEDNKIKETINLFLNASKSRKFLDWKPKFKISKSLETTSDWYEYYIHDKNLEKISKKQFDEYFIN